jgi:hypothetical protein
MPVGKGSSLSRGDAIGTETDLEANRLKVEVKTGDVERKSSVSAVLFCWRRVYTLDAKHEPMFIAD